MIFKFAKDGDCMYCPVCGSEDPILDYHNALNQHFHCEKCKFNFRVLLNKDNNTKERVKVK